MAHRYPLFSLCALFQFDQIHEHLCSLSTGTGQRAAGATAAKGGKAGAAAVAYLQNLRWAAK